MNFLNLIICQRAGKVVINFLLYAGMIILKRIMILFSLILLNSIDGKGQRIDSVLFDKTERMLDSFSVYQFTNRDKALEYAMTAADLAKQNNQQQLAVSLESVGLIYYFRGEFSKAEGFYKNALSIYNSEKSFKGIASINNNLGLLQQDKGNYVMAKKLFNRALLIDRQLKDATEKAYTLNNLGTVFYNQGIYDSAYNYFKMAGQLSFQENDTTGITNYYNNLGLLFLEQHDYKKAGRNFNEAKRLCRTTGDLAGELLALVNLGELSLDSGNTKRAIALFNQCLDRQEQLNDFEIRAYCLIALGNSYQKLELFQKSNDYYQQALKQLEVVNNRMLVSQVFTRMGVNFSQQGNSTVAFEYFKQSLTIALENGLNREIADNYKQMAVAASKVYTADSASGYIDIYTAFMMNNLKDTVYENFMDTIFVDKLQGSPDKLTLESGDFPGRILLVLAMMFTGLVLIPLLFRLKINKKNKDVS